MGVTVDWKRARAVAQQHGAVLAANQKLGGSSCGIVLQADASVHDAVTFIQHGAVARRYSGIDTATAHISQNMIACVQNAAQALAHSTASLPLHWLSKLSQVPPQYLTISGHRRKLRARLALQPAQVVHRVAVALFDGRTLHRRAALAVVPVPTQRPVNVYHGTSRVEMRRVSQDAASADIKRRRHLRSELC